MRPLRLLLEAGEHHLRAGDVLLRVGEVLVERVVVPRDSLALVGIRVGEAGGLSGLPADHAVEVRAHLVLAALLGGVALGAPLDENLLSLLDIVRHFDVLK